MVLPQTYGTALLLIIVSMLCWGSWANTFKLAGKWRFELFYYDYSLGVLIAATIYALTLGNFGVDADLDATQHFLDDFTRDDKLFRLALGDAPRLLAADGADLAFQVAHAGFARVAAHHESHRFVAESSQHLHNLRIRRA